MHIRKSKMKGVKVNLWKLGMAAKPDVLGFVLI